MAKIANKATRPPGKLHFCKNSDNCSKALEKLCKNDEKMMKMKSKQTCDLIFELLTDYFFQFFADTSLLHLLDLPNLFTFVLCEFLQMSQPKEKVQKLQIVTKIFLQEKN